MKKSDHGLFWSCIISPRIKKIHTKKSSSKQKGKKKKNFIFNIFEY